MRRREVDVLVVGAGPVGLFAALGLVERGLAVQVIDKDWRGASHSYALALHPRSLRLLDGCGVAVSLLEGGYPVDRIGLYEGDARVGELDLRRLDGSFPYVLVAPQCVLERTLEARLAEHKVKVLWNHQALSLHQEARGVAVTVGRMEKYSAGYPIARTEWMVAEELAVHASFVIGADGYHSFVRQAVGASFESTGRAEGFVVYEFPWTVEWPHEARVVLDKDTTSVMWPVNPERGRWSFEVDPQEPAPPTLDALQALIRARAPWFRTELARIGWHATALFERRLVDRFGCDRTWLAGDAAHVTGPVGAQSMNVGLSEADDLVETIASIVKGGGSRDRLAAYEIQRRAEWSKLLGIRGGMHASDASPAWLHRLAPRILPCVPASGADLDRLLEPLAAKVV